MLDNFKTKLSENCNPQSVIKQISRLALVHSLTHSQFEQLTKIVEGKLGNYKLHPKVSTTIYSIIIMKGYTNYNTKLAIQNLTKYYRSLSSSHGNQQADGKQKQQARPSKTKQVIANLLIRIPTFSNYKLIIKDLNPQLLPIHIISQHKAQIYKQCPNLYKQFLIKQHRHIWYKLMEGDQENYPLHKQFEVLKQGLTSIGNCKDWVQMSEIYQQMNRVMEFVRNRIVEVPSTKQQIDIEMLLKQISSILTFSVQSTQQRKLLPVELINRQNLFIRNIKTSNLQLFRLLITKIHFHFFRKLSSILSLVEQLIYRPYDSYSIEPAYLIDFCTTIIKVYGIGSFSFDKLVHDQSLSCVSVLVSALCYNNYQNNNKREQSLINYQSQSKSKNKNNKNNVIHINLNNGTQIESAYEPYLLTTSSQQRQNLLRKTLVFLKQYYGAKHKYGMQYYYSGEILAMLASSKTSISKANAQIISKIKNQILYKGYERIGQNIQMFCETVFNEYIKKRKQPKFQIYRTQQLLIQPTTKILNSNLLMQSSDRSSFGNLSMRRNISNQTQNYQQKCQNMNESANGANQLRKTHSFDLQIQGWNSGKKQGANRNDQKSGIEKSEMFYSIKQCSVMDQKDEELNTMKKDNLDENRREQGEQEYQEEFILTPEF